MLILFKYVIIFNYTLQEVGFNSNFVSLILHTFISIMFHGSEMQHVLDMDIFTQLKILDMDM